MSLKLRNVRLPMPVPRLPFARRPQPSWDQLRPTWRQARPGRIATALAASQERNPGGWFVAGRSEEVRPGVSLVRQLAGREVVLWRAADHTLRAGPGACPHLGALLDRCPVLDGSVVCRWHGLALGHPDDGASGHGPWQPYRSFDDGVLAWVGLPVEGEPATPVPVVPERPPAAESVPAVIGRRGRCEPVDVIANRLDPWHGAWFHPYSFSHLEVDDAASTDDRLVVDVTFRISRTWGVPVRAEFVCPDARTIVMRIVDGEGVGSVVETHATPITAPGAASAVTVMTEATIAYSDRPGFRVAHRLAPLLKPGMRHVAGRLWVDDLSYAERRYALRTKGEFPG